MRRSRFLLVSAIAAATLALPGAAFAEDLTPSANTIQITGPMQPLWRVTPPSTDPAPPMQEVQGMAAMRGTLLHGEGNLVLLDVAGDRTVVQLPDDGFDASTLPIGSQVQLSGAPVLSGVVHAFDVTVQR